MADTNSPVLIQTERVGFLLKYPDKFDSSWALIYFDIETRHEFCWQPWMEHIRTFYDQVKIISLQ